VANVRMIKSSRFRDTSRFCEDLMANENSDTFGSRLMAGQGFLVPLIGVRVLTPELFLKSSLEREQCS
jgi:hypothetical protein